MIVGTASSHHDGNHASSVNPVLRWLAMAYILVLLPRHTYLHGS